MTDVDNRVIPPLIVDSIDEPAIAPTDENAKKSVSHLARSVGAEIDSPEVDGRESDSVNSNVVKNYTGYGGAVGGGIIGLLVLGVAGVSAIVFAVFAVFLGFFIGMIPAAITGMLAEYYQLKSDLEGLIKVSGIGAIVTLLCMVIVMFLLTQENFEWTDISTGAIEFALTLGGVSAFLTGLGALPKPRHLPSVNID